MADNMTNLFTTIDLGLLAAGLTLLALYPAIGMLIKDRLSSALSADVVEQNIRRSHVLLALACAIGLAWAALLAILASALIGIWPHTWADALFVLTFLSMVSMGVAAYLIFQATSDFA